MQTIRLRVSSRVYKSLLELLSKFRQEDIQVIEEDDTYVSTQKYLEKELAAVEEGKAEYIDMEELEKSLEETIRKYET